MTTNAQGKSQLTETSLWYATGVSHHLSETKYFLTARTRTKTELACVLIGQYSNSDWPDLLYSMRPHRASRKPYFDDLGEEDIKEPPLHDVHLLLCRFRLNAARR